MMCWWWAVPAGAAAAWHLASVGVRVLVLEARPMPRRKVCAGAVSQKAVRLLQSWGIDITPVVEGSMVEIAFFYRYRHPAFLRHRQPYALNVCRDKCDQYLLQQAEQAGAAVRTGCPVRSVRLEADRHLLPARKGFLSSAGSCGGRRSQQCCAARHGPRPPGADGDGGRGLAPLRESKRARVG